MRNIKALREKYDGKLYVYCGNDEIGKRFLVDAEEEGFMFGEIKPTDNHVSDLIAIEDQKHICYVGTAGRIALQSGNVVCVDYEKYISGDQDYIYHK